MGVRSIEVTIKPASGGNALQTQDVGLQTSASLELSLADGGYVAEIWLDVDGGAKTLLASREFALITVGAGWGGSRQ